ncbi:MAG TPA: hypothetical protein V6C89_15805 [Drouetiella sp.]
MFSKAFCQVPSLLAISLLWLGSSSCLAESSEAKAISVQTVPVTEPGKAQLVESVVVTAGPFDIHRKYRSMEGPYVTESFKISDLLARKNSYIGEDQVKFVENGQQASMAGSAQPPEHELAGASAAKELLWIVGAKLVVLDENDRVLPTAEFICHFNLDLERRDRIFPQIHAGSNRLITITQGQTDVHFPPGCGVPVASNEYIHLKFQAANRTTEEHRRLKHRCTVDIVRDSDLKTPMTALSWYTPFMAIEVDKNSKITSTVPHSPDCLALSSGENAPNAIPGTVIDYGVNSKVSSHWKVLPGKHLYTCPLPAERDAGFNQENRTVRAIWTHCHPLCQKVVMLVCDGKKKTPLWSVDVSNKLDHGMEIEKISDFDFGRGVLLPKGKQLEIDAIYNNTTGEPQDSMVSQGVFFEVPNFTKPDWSKAPEPTAEGVQGDDRFCGIRPMASPHAPR